MTDAALGVTGHSDATLAGRGWPGTRKVIGTTAGSAAITFGLAGSLLLVLNTWAGALFPPYWLILLVGSVVYGAIGGWLVARDAGGVVGPLFVVVGLGHGVTLFAMEYGIYGLQVTDGLAGDRWAFWVSMWSWLIGHLVLFLLLPLVLPAGSLLSRRWRPVAAYIALAIGGQALAAAVTPYAQLDVPVTDALIGQNPVALPAAVTEWISVASGLSLIPCVVAVLVALVLRWRRTDAGQRRAVAWVFYGIGCGMVLGVVAFATDIEELAAAAIVPLPVCCLVAVTWHRLWDLQLVVRRSLVYAGLTATVAAVYAGVVGLLGGALGAGTGAPIVATAVVAILVLPLHHVLRRVVNRVVYGQPEDPYLTMARLGQRLGAAVTPDQMTATVLPETVRGVARALRLRHLSVSIAEGETVSCGAPANAPLELPCGTEDVVGTMRAVAGNGGLTRSERSALDDVAAQAAVAVHGVVLMRELQRERERVVAAREEERRRLRRALHDGVGPALAAASLQAEVARDLLPTQPDQGRALLDRLVGRLQETVVDVRALSRDLRPATLDELGLAGAVRELGARFGCAARPVVVDVGALGQLPAAVDVAVYLVAAELVANACRHSDAREVRVEVWRAAGGLLLRVSDDGIGMSTSAVAGVGLTSIQQRLREIGGEFAIGPSGTGRGTVADARFPLEVR